VFVCDKCSSSDKATEITAVPTSSVHQLHQRDTAARFQYYHWFRRFVSERVRMLLLLGFRFNWNILYITYLGYIGFITDVTAFLLPSYTRVHRSIPAVQVVRIPWLYQTVSQIPSGTSKLSFRCTFPFSLAIHHHPFVERV
jgi:hypothetical protein